MEAAVEVIYLLPRQMWLGGGVVMLKSLILITTVSCKCFSSVIYGLLLPLNRRTTDMDSCLTCRWNLETWASNTNMKHNLQLDSSPNLHCSHTEFTHSLCKWVSVKGWKIFPSCMCMCMHRSQHARQHSTLDGNSSFLLLFAHLAWVAFLQDLLKGWRDPIQGWATEDEWEEPPLSG